LSALLLIDIPWFLTEGKLAVVFIKTFSWGFPTGRSFTTSQQVFGHHHHRAIIVLIIPCSWGFPTGPVRHQDYFLALLPGRKRISTRGVSHFQSLYFVIVFLSFFALFCLLLFIKNTKKLVPTIVVIFGGLF
jgi:hypothetical protein